jgi:hypothetical protein
MAFGLLVGGSFILASLLFVMTGKGIVLNPRLNNVTSCLGIIGSFIGIKKLRDERMGGVITYGRAFAAGFKIILAATALHALYTFIIYSSLPGLIEEYRRVVTIVVEKLYSDTPLLAPAGEFLDRGLTPAFVAFGEFFQKALAGTFFLVIIAAILRHSRPAPVNTKST